MLVPLVLLAVVLVTAAPASAAGQLSIPVGGSLIDSNVAVTSAGSYLLTSAGKGRKVVASLRLLTPAGPATVGPALPAKALEIEGIATNEDGTVPCIGANVRNSPLVTCLEDGAWKERRFTGAARARGLMTIVRYGSALYAYLVDADVAVNKQHPERTKISIGIWRWDGVAWVNVLASYPFSFQAVPLPLECFAALPGQCAEPLLETVTLKTLKVRFSKLVAEALVADPRTFALTGSEQPVSVAVGVGDRLVMAARPRKGSARPLTILSDRLSGSKRIVLAVPRAASIKTDVSLAVVGGRLWAAWSEARVTDKKRERGTERLRAAPVDLDAGTLGPITEVRSGRFSGGPDSVDVIDIAGQPYAQTVRYGRTNDTLVLTPLPAA